MALLEGLEISEVLLSELEYSGRLDSEYYRPKFINYENIIVQNNGIELRELSNFLIGPFGSSFKVDNYTENPTFRYIRGKDVKPLKLMDNDNVYLPADDYERLNKYSLKLNDILVSVVGTLGNAALITDKDIPAIFSCKSTVLRPFNINPVFLLVYVNTKYGRALLLRKERGAIQKGLNLDDLKTLLIFNPTDNFQKTIEKLFRNSLEKTKLSKQTYTQAETLLLETLGLKDFQPSHEKVNIKSFKDSFLSTGRLDAEYYQVKYEQIIKKIKESKHARLSELVSITKSIEPGSKAYSDEGLPFLRVADYNKFGISKPDKNLSLGYCADNSKLIESLKLKKDTILFSKDGSVGTALVVTEDLDLITSGAILHLTVKDNKEVLPQYLALTLNSIAVQMQAERDAGGSIILHWRPDEIKQVVVPIIDYDKQQQISKLIEESFRLKAQSEHLLEVAKQAVEIAIEEGEHKGVEWIEKEFEQLNIEK